MDICVYKYIYIYLYLESIRSLNEFQVRGKMNVAGGNNSLSLSLPSLSLSLYTKLDILSLSQNLVIQTNPEVTPPLQTVAEHMSSRKCLGKS